MNGREARLKHEYASEYPGITPDVWMPVRDVVRKLIERVQHGRRAGRFTRTFDPTHFEFRGGSSEPRSAAARTRSTDLERRPPQTDDSDQERQLES